MARALATAFEAPLVTSTVSRLLIDLNRSIGHPQLFSAATRAAPDAAARGNRRAALSAVSRRSRALGRASGGARTARDPHLVAQLHAGPGRRRATRRRGPAVRPGADAARRSSARAGRRRSRAIAPQLRVRRNYPYAGKGDGLTSYLRRRFPHARLRRHRARDQPEASSCRRRAGRAARCALIAASALRCIDALQRCAAAARHAPSRSTTRRPLMQIRVGFEMIYECPQPTPMILNAQRSLHARLRPRRPRRPRGRPAGAHGGLSRQLRQLVHAHRRADGPHAHLRRCDRQRLRRARRDRAARRSRFRCRTCPRKPCSSCSAAGIAKPIGCPRRRGACSDRRRRDGTACRRSATTSTATSPSATSTPG